MDVSANRFFFNLSGVKKPQATATSTSKSEISLPMRGFECTAVEVRTNNNLT